MTTWGAVVPVCRSTVAGLAAALVLASALSGCGSDDGAAQDAPQTVVQGVLLDGDAPAEGVELELLVWPSPQAGASASPQDGPDLVQVDTVTTGGDGAFDLEAVARELSPHAAGDGLVGLEVRRVGAEAGMRTTVRLAKEADTGRTQVAPVTGLELPLSAVGGAAE